MNLKLNDVQMEEVTLLCLEQYHHDLKMELCFYGLEPYFYAEEKVDVINSLIAVNTIMQDLMTPHNYTKWHLENGVEL